MSTSDKIKLRPLERDDLRFVHKLDNNETIMRYWFEEAYEAYVELCDLYDKHIHDLSERRFIIEKNGESLGLVELVEINHIHRRAEFQLIIDPVHQGRGYAKAATQLGLNYAFSILNLYKLYLLVDSENKKAIHIYQKMGFQVEGEFKHEFFSHGQYRNAIRMSIFQSYWLPSVTP